jgi:hypothetical protein
MMQKALLLSKSLSSDLGPARSVTLAAIHIHVLRFQKR